MSSVIDTTINFASLGAFITIIIAIYFNNRQLKAQNKKTSYDFFAIYTGRYQKIMQELPVNIYDDKFEFQENDGAIKLIRSYFDLCYEQYFLNEQGVLGEEVWNDWFEGMKKTFRCKAFKDLWEKEYIPSEYFDEKGFIKFVNEELLKN